MDPLSNQIGKHNTKSSKKVTISLYKLALLALIRYSALYPHNPLVSSKD